jgi:predicted MFS family arabinose efflux permease
MIWCNAGRLVLLASIPTAAAAGHLSLVHLFIVAGGVGILTIFFDVSYQSYLPSLVGPELLIDGNGKLGTTQSFARFAGPSAGGGLVGLFGVAWAVAADALSYLVSIVTLLWIRVPESAPAGVADRPRFRTQMVEGLSFIVRHRFLRPIVLCSTTSLLFVGGIEALFVVYQVRVLGASAAVVGVVYSLAALGGIAGGLLAGRLNRRIGQARILWQSQVACVPFLVLLPLASPGIGVLLCSIGWGVYGFASVVYNTAQVSYRQAVCPPELLGRLAAAARMLVWGALPLGQLAGGALAEFIGIRSAIWVCVIGVAVAPVWILASPLRRLRDFPVGAGEGSGRVM